MLNYTDITGLVSVASATAAGLLLLPGIASFSKSRRAIFLGGAFILMLIPFGGMPLAAYVRGVSGDLSITTMLLLWGALLRPWLVSTNVRSRRALLLLIALAALTLYPLALGIGAFDPYSLGYGNSQFVTVLLLLGLGAWFKKYYWITLCVSLATFAWAIGWYESDNLWDYLLDPFVAIYAQAAIITHTLQRLRPRKK